jgi:hypothetical protein
LWPVIPPRLVRLRQNRFQIGIGPAIVAHVATFLLVCGDQGVVEQFARPLAFVHRLPHFLAAQNFNRRDRLNAAATLHQRMHQFQRVESVDFGPPIKERHDFFQFLVLPVEGRRKSGVRQA